MVTIVNYKSKQTSEGKSFCNLILEGELELVQNAKNGNFYATARKASITSTFNEDVCKRLIGKALKGSIVKVKTESYEYSIPESGEVITLDYKYCYVPESDGIEDKVFQ